MNRTITIELPEARSRYVARERLTRVRALEAEAARARREAEDAALAELRAARYELVTAANVEHVHSCDVTIAALFRAVDRHINASNAAYDLGLFL